MLWSLLFISLTALCKASNVTELKGMTSQSSTYTHGNLSHISERAIDGNLSQCAHTSNTDEQKPWWRIDLRSVYRISSVRIHNPDQINNNTDITGAQIHISNSKALSSECISPMCKNISDFKQLIWNSYNFTGASGRYITVVFPGSFPNFLILCEVKIFGTIKESPFELIRQNKTWEEALYHCLDKNMDLASIVDEETQAWAELEAKNANSPFVWLGLRYTCTLDFWFWVNGQFFEFNRWGPNGTQRVCDMSGVMKIEDQSWYSRPDLDMYNFICTK